MGDTKNDSIHPSKLAISLSQLNEVNAQARDMLGDRYGSANMRVIVAEIIEPLCETSQLSYARIVNQSQPLEVTVFVSHCWDENFQDFVSSVNHTFKHWAHPPNLWICAFALYQTKDRNLIADQVATGKGLHEAPFTKALRAAQTILVVRNTAVDIYSRIWPIWEIYLAYKMGFFKKHGGFMIAGSVAFSDGVVDILKADAADLNDKATICKTILNEGQYDEVNRIITEIRAFGK